MKNKGKRKEGKNIEERNKNEKGKKIRKKERKKERKIQRTEVNTVRISAKSWPLFFLNENYVLRN